MGIKIAGQGVTGSIKSLKKSLEKGGTSGTTWIKNVPDEGITVRFLSEPNEWYAYKEHYSNSARYFPCVDKSHGCPGCNSMNEQEQRISNRFLANAVDIENDRVIPLKLAKTLVQRLVVRFERHGETIMDRDFTLYKIGTGKETTYDVSDSSPEGFAFEKYTLLDVEKILIDRYEEAFGADDEDDPFADITDSGVVTTNGEKVPWDDADEDDDEDYLTEDDLKKMKVEELRALAVQLGAEVSPVMKKDALIEKIVETAGE